MTLLAFRNLITEKTRFAFSAAGIGFAVFLITILLGLYQGWNQKVGGFVEKVDGDAWVAREGTTDFINAASILPVSLGDSIASTDGIASVHQLIVRPMAFEKNGHKVDIHLIGYETSSGVGGPLKIIKGKGDPQGDEIVIDEVLVTHAGRRCGRHAHERGLIGEGGRHRERRKLRVHAGGIHGHRRRTKAALDGRIDDVLRREHGPGRGHTGVAAAGVGVVARRRCVHVGAVRLGDAAPDPRPGDPDHRADRRVWRSSSASPITSLTIYTATVERTREFGVMKAIGFNNMDLYKLVLSQSLITGLLGFVFGALATLLVSRFIDRLVAQFIVLVRPQDIALVLVATLVMALGAAIVPARRVAGVDPAVAFKG